jgi:hypothetical protein
VKKITHLCKPHQKLLCLHRVANVRACLMLVLLLLLEVLLLLPQRQLLLPVHT